MTGTLHVCVDLLTYENDLASGSSVVGNIYPASRTGGTAHRNVIIPCGPDVTPQPFAVDPGRYVVSVSLPSGMVLTGDTQVAEGKDVTIRLDASDSPFETHAWQYLMGNIEPRHTYWNDQVTVPTPNSKGSRYLGDPQHDAEVAAPPRVTWIGDSLQSSWSFDSMLDLTRNDPVPYADRIAESPPFEVTLPSAGDGKAQLFRFGPDGPVNGPAGPTGARQFVLVELGTAAHLVSLPLPWEDAQVEVLVNARQNSTGSAVSVAVRDPAVGAGLAYMSRGAFEAAARLFTNVEEMLYSKVQNPLAATAAAYVLVGSDYSDEERHWDDWISNLREWFGWISDGSVLWATRKLRRAHTEDDLDAAKRALVEAFDRGVPLYTLGLSWLQDGLSEFPEDPACASRLEAVRELSWSVDMREPFVITTLGGFP